MDNLKLNDGDYSSSHQEAKFKMQNRSKNEAVDENKIARIWEQMDDNERIGLKFSLFPAWTIAEKLTKEETVRLMEMSEQETGALA